MFEDIYDKAASDLAKKKADAVVMPLDLEVLTEHDLFKVRENAKRFGLSEQEVLWSVLNDKVAYLNVVSKATSRQGLPEKVLLDYIEKNGFVQSIVKLPAGGQNALYLIDGVIRSKADGVLTGVEISNAGVKSLDFKIVTLQGVTGYIAAKHTKSDGGSQDNQYNDILTTLGHFRDGADFFLVANVDGEYYSKPRNKYAGKSYIEFMKENYPFSNVFITTYDTFGAVFKDR